MTCISLDLHRSNPPEPWKPQQEPRPEPKRQGIARILVAEDDETVLEVVSRMLEDAGYEVLLAVNGAEAFDMIENDPAVDLLITDLRMPRMGGKDLADRLRSMRPDMPVIFISGYNADWNTGIVSSPTRILLRKPFTEADLLQAIHTILGE